MNKQKLLSYKIFIENGEKRKPNPLKALKCYSHIKEAVEIDINSFIEVITGEEDIPYSPMLLYNAHIPFKHMLFIGVYSTSVKEYEVTALLSLVHNTPLKKIYEFHLFNEKKGFLNHDEHYTIICESNKQIDITQHRKEYLRENFNDIDLDDPFNKEIIKKMIDNENWVAEATIELYEHKKTLNVHFFNMCICAMTYMNQNQVLQTDILSPDLIDNDIVQITGNVTRTVFIKPGVQLNKFKLMNPRESPKEHMVRGHYKYYKTGKIIWVDSFKRGDASKGTVTQIYVPEGNRFINWIKKWWRYST